MRFVKRAPFISFSYSENMAAFRRNLLTLLSNATEFSGENEKDTASQLEDDSLDTSTEHDDVDYDEEHEDAGEDDLGQDEFELQESGASTQTKKPKKKQGRKSVWPEDTVNDLIDVICESDYYRKKLIFTNNKPVKNSEVYAKVAKDSASRLASRGASFPFTVAQIRIKFKACISACKKAAMTRKTASGIDNFINAKGYGSWFKKLYPYVESRDSCDPDMGVEPSFQILSQTIENSPEDEGSGSSNKSLSGPSTAKKAKKDLFVPVPSKRSKETTNDMLKEAVKSFNSFVEKDGTASLLACFREENEKSRQHERELAQLQMQMLHNMLMATTAQQHGSAVNNHFGAINQQRNTASSQNAGFQYSQMPNPNSRGNNNESQFSNWISFFNQNEDEQF